MSNYKAYYFNPTTGQSLVPGGGKMTEVIPPMGGYPKHYIDLDNGWVIGIEGVDEQFTQHHSWSSALRNVQKYGRALTPVTTPKHPHVIGTAVGPYSHFYSFLRDGTINAGCKSFKNLKECKSHYLSDHYDGVYRDNPQDGVDFIELNLSALKNLMGA
jgi:hypothetical protein